MKRSVWSVLVLLLAACQPSSDEPMDTVSNAAAPDGTNIAYRVLGKTAGPTLVFVHCWSCNRQFWREQLPVFANDYRVVALDLGGHGESSADRESWSVKELAGDVKAVADQLELTDMVLIGHSMGGPVSLEAARLMTGRVRGLIAVDTLHDADFDYAAASAELEQMVTALETDFPGAMAGMFTGMAADQIDKQLADWIVAQASEAEPNVAIPLIKDFLKLDMPQMFSAAGVPIRAINAMPGPSIPKTNIEGNREYADYDATLMDGVGHFLQLEAPAEFNKHLQAYVIELTGNIS